jgi:hypothetical protein
MTPIIIPTNHNEWKTMFDQLALAQKVNGVSETEEAYINDAIECFKTAYPRFAYRFKDLTEIVEKTQKLAQMLDDVEYPFSTCLTNIFENLADSLTTERLTEYTLTSRYIEARTLYLSNNQISPYIDNDEIVGAISTNATSPISSISLTDSANGAYYTSGLNVLVLDKTKIIDGASISVYAELLDGRTIETTFSISLYVLWTPANTTVEAWWDANEENTITYNTSNLDVTQWDDKSGNNHSLTINTATDNEPKFNINKVTFDGTKQFLACYDQFLYNLGQASIFIVQKENITSASSVVLGEAQSTAASNDYLFKSRNDALGVEIIDDTTTTRLDVTSLDTTTFDDSINLISITDSGTEINSYTNGNTDLSSVSYTRGTSNPSTFFLGAVATIIVLGSPRATVSQAWGGDIYEVVIVDSVLSMADRQKIEGYLAWKWGIQDNLPVGHLYKNIAPVL